MTVKQMLDIIGGRSMKHPYLRPEVIQKYGGLLKNRSESDLKRITIKLLLLGVLKEIFQEG
jgi:hypothetical protein